MVNSQWGPDLEVAQVCAFQRHLQTRPEELRNRRADMGNARGLTWILESRRSDLVEASQTGPH